MTKRIKVKIKGGNIQADFQGFSGTDCEKLDQKLRPESFELINAEKKPEYSFETTSENTEHEFETGNY
ncbi:MULTISPECIES: hypothetical protein [Vibrio]|uniref:DUF2997 domain-containing protein n=3 Tax=Vibrio TaxID=662 RepID=A0AAU9QRS7_9VIBR|nr:MULTISPECIES: hypothetical protein [Vibrio]CAH1589925.1 conserved hypothetical protein [Vibrio jasicida]KIF53144.1 hypothetical protein H735_09395 [Vibrio owensii CAIM 1854 = LMG 25443]MCZ2798866.1 hypothetical protein [Vibrio alginolyticus]PAW02274.1 hypothetical protein CKJ79_16570 [Vibrio coralliilyticus]POB46992.1 hypothetical protein CRN52_13015 [Vibrio vulnificus]